MKKSRKETISTERTFQAARKFSTDFHPAVEFLYFALVLGFGMFLLHPFCLLFSFAGALFFSFRLRGKRAVRRSLIYMLPILFLTAAANPLFSHGGETVLAYFPSGNPLTLESLLYGLGAACMLACMLLWFMCVTEVVTAEKCMWLFGRILPALSLLLSMTLRFVPSFIRRLRGVNEARRCMGVWEDFPAEAKKGQKTQKKQGLRHRGKEAVKAVSILLTWALENAVETADSMRARGYGLPGRTAFSLYRFTGRDRAAVSLLLFCGFFLLSGCLAGAMEFRYFPTVKGVFLTEGPVGPLQVCFFLVYGALCLAPWGVCIHTAREVKKWEYMKG